MSSSLIRVAPSGKYFRFGDGRPFMPLGHNTYSEVFTVYGYESTLYPVEQLEERFARLAEHGGNFLRLFIPANLQRGFFRTGQMDPEEEARLDLVFALGEKYGLYFYVELLMSQYYTAWYHADQWLASPYNSANGGPVTCAACPGPLPANEHPDFLEKYRARLRMGYSLDNAEFVRAQQAKLQWFLDRFSGNPHVFCWGLSNDLPLHDEMDEVLQPWLREMSGYLREHDRHHHLLTLQTYSGTVWPEWVRDCLDFTSIRAYPWSTPGIRDDALPEEVQGRNPNNIAIWLNHKAKEHLAYGQPAICGEYGGCTVRTDDAHGQRFSLDNRDLLRSRATLYGLWAPLCSGSMPGHRWTGYDGFYPLTTEEYGWLAAVRAFCDRVNWAAFDPHSADEQVSVDRSDCSVVAVADESLLLAWVWDRLWVGGPRRVPVSLRLREAPAGPVRVEWVDCYTGRITRAETYAQAPTELALDLDECAALVIRRL
ncbi:MAG TPA: hypothetical protein VGM19_06485 [Armatimonadota bacterium]|jgi:hypothetical protein